MAKITKTIGAPNSSGRSQVLMRVTICRSKQIRLKSGIFVPADRWNRETGRLNKPRADRKLADELSKLERQIEDIERSIQDTCETIHPDEITKQLLEQTVSRVNGKKKSKDSHVADTEQKFFDIFNRYVDTIAVSESSKKNFQVVIRILERFAKYKRTQKKGWALSFEIWDTELINELYWFLGHEPEVYASHPGIYNTDYASTCVQRKASGPRHKGENAKTGNMKRFRTFWRWAMRSGYVTTYPFRNFQIKAEVYGTPFYLTKKERDALAAFDFSSRAALGIQRDIFIFQCLTGCRVSDLSKLRQSNIVRDAIEYIPQKTIDERAETVRVPLCAKARELLKAYASWRKGRDEKDPPLFPFISDQKYNTSIKDMLRIAGIDRPVTVLNPLTRQEERRAICDVASSHMARRTFIGILYKQVKDPSLVGALSGHKEGSRAFVRYREIDEDIKRDLVDLL